LLLENRCGVGSGLVGDVVVVGVLIARRVDGPLRTAGSPSSEAATSTPSATAPSSAAAAAEFTAKASTWLTRLKAPAGRTAAAKPASTTASATAASTTAPSPLAWGAIGRGAIGSGHAATSGGRLVGLAGAATLWTAQVRQHGANPTGRDEFVARNGAVPIAVDLIEDRFGGQPDSGGRAASASPSSSGWLGRRG